MYVALLRGINVGRGNRIAMADLREAMTGAGYQDVRTHLQSGNVIFSAGPLGEPEAALTQLIEARFGMKILVVVRTCDQLARVVADDPFTGVATDPSSYLVSFLAEPLSPQMIKDFDPGEYTPDQTVLTRSEIYHWYPEGVLAARFSHAGVEKRFGIRATARNWRTVTRVLDLAS